MLIQFCLDTLSILLMWAIITGSKVWTGVELDPEIMASLWAYDCLLASLDGEVLSTDHMREERGRCLVGNEVLSTEVREVGESIRCCG
jgi:hypothetical protein